MVITEEEMKNYLKANQILIRLGYAPIWNEDLTLKELHRLNGYSFSVEDEKGETV